VRSVDFQEAHSSISDLTQKYEMNENAPVNEADEGDEALDGLIPEIGRMISSWKDTQRNMCFFNENRIWTQASIRSKEQRFL
jgi:hypothetical protein